MARTEELTQITLIKEGSSNPVTLSLRGKITREVYELFVPEIERLTEEHGKIRLLVEWSILTAGPPGHYERTRSSPPIISPTSSASPWSEIECGRRVWPSSASPLRAPRCATSTGTTSTTPGPGCSRTRRAENRTRGNGSSPEDSSGQRVPAVVLDAVQGPGSGNPFDREVST